MLIVVRDHISATPRESLQTESEFIIDILFSDKRVITLGVTFTDPSTKKRSLLRICKLPSKKLV